MVRTSIQARVVAVFIGLMLVVVVAISGSMTQVFTNNFTRELAEPGPARRARCSSGSSKVCWRSPTARRNRFPGVRASGRCSPPGPDVLKQVLEQAPGPGQAFDSSDFMAALDPQGALLAVSAAGPGGRDTLAVADALNLVGTEVVQNALARDEAGESVDTLGPGKIAAIGAAPVFDPENSQKIGVLVSGRLIDLEYLQEQRSEGEVFLITRTEVLASTTRTTDGIIPADRRNVADPVRRTAGGSRCCPRSGSDEQLQLLRAAGPRATRSSRRWSSAPPPG